MNFKAFGRKKPGVMNRLESKYAEYLDQLKNSGQILWYSYESIKLKLADKTFLTIDFFVMKNDLSLEAHECKGYMMDDANVKIKCAAEKFPFKFIVVKKDKSGWKFREV